MARLALTAVGGIAGSLIGQPALGLAAGSVLGNLILGPAGPDQKAEGLSPDQLRVQTSRYGKPLPIKYGTIRLPAMVTWSSGIIEIENDVDEGGKGGGSGDAAQAPFSYFSSWECTFSEGVVTAFSRIWFDSKVMFDVRDSASAETRRNSEVWAEKYLAFYPGAADDSADPTIQAYEAPANVPAGRGKCRMVFTDHPLADFGNRLPQVTAELTLQSGLPITWNYAVPGPIPPPNANWTVIDAIYRHWRGTEPHTSGSMFVERRDLIAGGTFELDTQYTFACEGKIINPESSNRAMMLTFTNTDQDAVQLRVFKDGGVIGGAPIGSLSIMSAWSVTDRGDGWYRLSLTCNTGSGAVPSWQLQLAMNMIAGTHPYSAQYNRSGKIIEVKNPSFATVTGVPAGTEPLADVISNICTRCAPLVASDIDVSEIPADRAVRGYAIGQQSGRGALENLQATHFFDGFGSQGKIKFVPRGGPVVATIDTEEMIVSSGQAEPLTIIRGGELELPKRVSLGYLNQSRAYQSGEAHQQRIVTRANGEQNSETRVVISADEAGKAADALLYGAWVERTTFRFTLPIKYFYLDPGDTIKITDKGDEYIVRQTAITLQSLIQLACECVEENPELYSSNWTAQNGRFDEDPVGDAATSTLEMMDIPMLADTQNDTRIHFALSGASASWGGGNLFKSRDGGASYQSVQAVTVSGRVGVINGALPAGNLAYWDNVTVLDFTLDNPDQALSSVSELAVLNGANAFAAGLHGRWEILQAQNIANTGPGTWRATRLLRGRLGTEANVGNHAASDRIVMLAAGFIRTFATNISELGVERFYKGVSVSLDPAEVTAKAFTYTGVNLRPYNPVHIAGSRDGSNNLTITWVRRSRFPAPLFHRPILGESSEQYKVEIFSGTSVVRELSATSPTAAYSAAQQSADGFTPGDPIPVKVYQLSEIVGWGYPGGATV